MSSGKELARTVTCGLWKEKIETKHWFCSAYIYDNQGQIITPEEAETKSFCHLRILLKGDELTDEFVDLLATLLKEVADGPGESMGVDVFQTYGFYEIVIS